VPRGSDVNVALRRLAHRPL